jgi:hypothetical protein
MFCILRKGVVKALLICKMRPMGLFLIEKG